MGVLNMPKKQLPAKVRVLAAIAAFAIAAICFSGVVLKNDLVGRLIFGATWSLVGVWWLGQWLKARERHNSV
jgi:hypothetical protein